MKKGDLISTEEILLRRVYFTDKHYIKPDGTLSSRAFAPRPKDEGKLSVDIERLTTYEKAILDVNKFRLYQIKAEIAYSIELKCIYDPLTLEDNNVANLAHSLIVGFEEEDEAKSAILAKNATKIDYP
jgi:hypothetical protein